MPMTSARLVPLPDGPYEVTGPVTIARQDGEPIGPPAGKVYLCRCAGSANKPSCDCLHALTGWNEDA